MIKTDLFKKADFFFWFAVALLFLLIFLCSGLLFFYDLGSITQDRVNGHRTNLFLILLFLVLLAIVILLHEHYARKKMVKASGKTKTTNDNEQTTIQNGKGL